jgi:putative ABC transport system permease protein
MVLRAQLPDGASLLESWNAARHAAAELPDVEAFSISTPGAALGFGTADGGGAECRHCSFGGLGVPVTIGRARHMAVDEAFFLMLGSGLPHSMEPGKVLVNATLVREWFQDGEFIGRRLWIAGDAPFLGAAYRVADVVELAPPVGLGSALLPGPAVYGALEDFPPRRADILVRARADSSRSDVVVALLATLAKAIPGVSLESLGSLDDVAAEHAAPVRWLSSWILVFAAAALMFAVVGLGAAMMDRVRARTAEIGVQRAVGARRFHVLKGVLADSAGVVATGGVVGAALGASAGRGLSLLLGGISPPPVGILGGIVGLAGLVTIVGAVGASVWALNVDPVVALRDH